MNANTGPNREQNRQTLSHSGIGCSAHGTGAAGNADEVAHAALLLHQLLLGLCDLGPQPVIKDEVVANLIVTVALGPEVRRGVAMLADPG